MSEPFQECEHLTGKPLRLCRGEAETIEVCNKYRVHWGMSPLPENAGDGKKDQTARGGSVRMGAKGDGAAAKEQGVRPAQKPLTLFERAVSASKAVAKVAVHGFTPLPDDQIASRLAICETCDQFAGSRCKLCGCGCNGTANLLNKLAHADQKCPHDPPKWGPVLAQQEPPS